MNNEGLETDSADQPLLAVKNLDRSYEIGGHRIEVLKGLELSVAKQNTIAVVGASGVGKSTLLHILGTLDHPTRGKCFSRGGIFFNWARRSWPGFATGWSALFFSFITSCRNLMRWKIP